MTNKRTQDLFDKALKATKKKSKLPKRLSHLHELPHATFIGRVRNIDFVAYKPEKISSTRKAMAKFKTRRGIPLRVSGLTPSQMTLVDDEINLSTSGDNPLGIRTGTTYLQGSASSLQDLASRIQERLQGDDHEAIVGENSNKDLTKAQIQFGAKARVKSIKNLVKKIQRELP